MREIKYNSKFNKVVRIRGNQLEWLSDNKPEGVRTVAGFLDIIINEYKKDNN